MNDISFKDLLNEGHLSIKDICSHPTVMHYCTYFTSELKTPSYKGMFQRSYSHLYGWIFNLLWLLAMCVFQYGLEIIS